MHTITGDDLVSDVATYLWLDDAGDDRAWTAFTELREAYRAEDAGDSYRLSRGDDRVLVGPPSLDVLVSVYNRGLPEEADSDADRWNGTSPSPDARDRFARETRDDLTAVMDRRYLAFSTIDTFVYRDDDTIAVLVDEAEHVDPVDRPQEKVSLEEIADFYRLARDTYGDVDACREMFGLMRDLYGCGDCGGPDYEAFHDSRRDHTLVFDRDTIRLVDPRADADGFDDVDLSGVGDQEPAPLPDSIDFHADDTVFEQLFDPATFGPR